MSLPVAVKEYVKHANGQDYKYGVYKLVDEYDPILKQSLQPVDFEDMGFDAKYWALSLIHTMLERSGVGLTASQIGLPYRMFAMGTPDTANIVINPEIIEVLDKEEEPFLEGCLSYPGLFLNISRVKKVMVKFYDMNGKDHTRTFDGLTARIFLHEFDHINGVTFISKVTKWELEKAKKKVKKNIKQTKAHRENLIKRQKAVAKLQELQKLQLNSNANPVGFNFDKPVPAKLSDDTILTIDTSKR